MFLLISGYFANNLPLFTGEVLDIYAKLEMFFGQECKDTDVVYINTAYDNELIKRYELGDFDGAKRVDLGNTAISDRTTLYRFLSYLRDVNYKYLIIDIKFKKNYNSDATTVDEQTHDTVLINDKLFNLIENMRDVVVATHDGIKLANPKLESKAALSDFYYTPITTNFVRYEYFDSIPYIPLKVYNDFSRQQGKDTVVCYYPFGLHILKPLAIYTQGNQLCYNSLFIDFPKNATTHSTQERGENRIYQSHDYVYNIGKLVKQNKKESEIHEDVRNICDSNIVIIGDITEDDIHDTYVGKKSGPEIIYRAFKALDEGKHFVSLWQMSFIFVIYFFISLFILGKKSIFDYFNLKVRNKFTALLADVCSFSSVFALYNIVLYLSNRESFSFTLPILLFTLIKLYKKLT